MTQATLKMQLEIVEEFTVDSKAGSMGQFIDNYVQDHLTFDGSVKGISIEFEEPLRLHPLTNKHKKALARAALGIKS